jgi:hypothetical protein
LQKATNTTRRERGKKVVNGNPKREASPPPAVAARVTITAPVVALAAAAAAPSPAARSLTNYEAWSWIDWFAGVVRDSWKLTALLEPVALDG